MHFMLYTPLPSTFVVTFFEILLPALVEEHDSRKCMNVKSCQKQLLRPSNRTDYTYFWAVYGTWDLPNRWEKCVFLVYVPSLEALFAPMCSTACIFNKILIFSQCFRHDFVENGTLLREVTPHKYVRLALPVRHVVYMSPWCLWIHWTHWIHWIHVLLPESPTVNCMLIPPPWNCRADQK